MTESAFLRTDGFHLLRVSDSALLTVSVGQSKPWNVSAMKHSDNLMKVSCPKIFPRWAFPAYLRKEIPRLPREDNGLRTSASHFKFVRDGPRHIL